MLTVRFGQLTVEGLSPSKIHSLVDCSQNMSLKQSHEVQATLAEYMRELTHAIGHYDFDVTGNRVTVRDGERRVLIDLVYEGSRHLGSLDLPMTRVDYEFVGYGEEGMNAFMERLSHHIQRLGG
jgi:hypothetical protein